MRGDRSMIKAAAIPSSFTEVAAGAERLIARRQVHAQQPAIESYADKVSNLLTMFLSIPVDVIYSQIFGSAATGTSITVTTEDNSSKSLIISMNNSVIKLPYLLVVVGLIPAHTFKRLFSVLPVVVPKLSPSGRKIRYVAFVVLLAKPLSMLRSVVALIRLVLLGVFIGHVTNFISNPRVIENSPRSAVRRVSNTCHPGI